ncbi:chromosome partitioning protein [Micromonospora sp. NPDC004540]|uniref:chromosome partitioning protein n=1 Tax=Micromonospora sp. NPDC004540 TaxID=3154457 RepID=UPI0033A14523
MVHENADRAHVPGQPQVPERDIEPLWPPEQTDPAVTAPPWAAPAQPNSAAWPVPPADAAPATPWPQPPAPDEARAGDGVPPARAAQPPVDLDLPFTLDQPAPAPATATTGGPDGEVHIRTTTTPGASAPRPATTAGPDETVGTPTTTAPGATAPPPAKTSDSADGIGAEAATAGGAAGSPGDRGIGTPPNGRPESPWAQPPQRATADTATPAPHAEPVPPSPQAGAMNPPQATTTGAVNPPQPPTTGPTQAAPDPTPPAAGPTAPGPAVPLAEAAPLAQVGLYGGPENPAEAAGGSPEAAAPRLGPFPPSPGVPHPQPYGDGTAYPPGPVGYGQPAPQAGAPGWYPPAWPQQAGPPPQPGSAPQPPAPHPQPGPHQQPGPQQPGPAAYPEQVWTPASGAPPTAEDFARRRQARPVDPVATMGVRAVVNKIGLVRLPPGRQEQEMRRDIEMVRRNFGGLRQVTVVNPKGGAGKTVAILLLAMTFGQKRGGYVLAWDNNETQGTLGMRAQQDFHSRTVRDMLRDLAQFQGPHGRVGDLSQYVRSQGEGMFDVLASDESATGGEMLTAAAFAEIREVVSRFYKLIFVDTGNNVRAQNWQAAMDATDQLVVTMSARNDSAETAARMLDHLEQSGRQRLVRQAVTVVSMPPSRKEIDLPAIQEHFAARTRAVLLAPYERLIDTGEPIRYGQLSSATRDAWLKIAAAVAEGL